MKYLPALTKLELCILIAIIVVLAMIAKPKSTIPGPRAQVSRVRFDMRTYSTALEAYYVDEKAFPPAASPLPHFSDKYRTPRLDMRTSMVAPINLTTPVAYLSALFFDPFTWVPYAYAPIEGEWLLYSPGPDMDFDINAELIELIPLEAVNIYLQGSATYDPSNGTLSSGDIWRLSE